MSAWFHRLAALFDQAVSLPAGERDAWLDTLDLEPEQRQELMRLLAADAQAAALPLTERFDTALTRHPGDPGAGVRLGPWRLLSELGAGGSGVVWLAERADTQYEQRVAIKINRRIAAADAARQLRHERQILATLDHPAIARLLDGGETDDGHPYLVMEYVAGEPITQAARRRGLDLPQRVALVTDLARGVHYAHQRLVIHRDIKPGNILLREDGRPALLDFGIAKLFEPGEMASAPTLPWFTPAYASPEQKRNQPVSTATDVYALGLVLCELLTDCEPEVDEEGRVTAPSRRVPRGQRRSLAGDLDAVVARASAPEPSRRYASAEALALDLERWRHGHPVAARPDSRTYRIGKFVRRHPLGIALGLAALGVIATTTLWLHLERQRALAAESRAQAEARAAAAVSDFLIGVFREAEPGSGKTRQLSPVQLIDRGRQSLAQRSELATETRVRIGAVLGGIYGRLGEPERATSVLRQAIEQADDAGLPVADRIALRQLLASVLDDRAMYPAAEKRYREAHALAEAADLPEALLTADAGIGLMLAKQRRHGEAEPLLRQVIRDSSSAFGADAAMTARARMFLAEELMLSDRGSEALAESERAARALRQHLAPDDPELLGLLTTHAAALRVAGNTDAAIGVLEGVIAEREALLDHNSFLLANAYSALGSAYYEQGRTLDATRQLVAALEIGRATLDANDPSFAIDLNNVGSLYEEQGDYARAEPFLREALAIYVDHAETEPYQLANVSQNLGRLLMLAGQAEESLRILSSPIADQSGSDWDLQRARQQLHLADWDRRYGSAQRGLTRLLAIRIEDLGGADSPRYGAWLRARGLMAAQLGDGEAAEQNLRAAEEQWIRTRNPRYVGVGEIKLERAELARRTGDEARALALAAEAAAILEPVLAARAPQRQRLAQFKNRNP